MTRFHVHVSVRELAPSTGLYIGLCRVPPTVVKPDYAKRMLESPRLNFAIPASRGQTGIEHLGLQVDSGEKLAGLRDRMQAADPATVAEPGASCCAH